MNTEHDRIRRNVREGYGKIAKSGGSCCGPSCCAGVTTAGEMSKAVGYDESDMQSVPDGANLGLGCGNPVAVASLKNGETVLDLGSGAGFDAFLAAKQVGKSGHVIGVDMTPEMIDRARRNREKGDFDNVEFRLGEIENLPVADNAVDVILSNCVINLAPDKKKVFREAFRVLKSGGRLMVSDLVRIGELPETVRNSLEAYVGCIAGTITREDYLGAIREAGFTEVTVVSEATYPLSTLEDSGLAREILEERSHGAFPMDSVAQAIASLKVRAVKP